MMTAENSTSILSILEGYYGQTKADLNFTNLYELTVAVVLSAQTTDKQVNAVTGELFRRYPDFSSLARADLSDVEIIVRSTGFYRNKSKNIIGLSRAISDNHEGKVPKDMDELVKLPGVGRKSANVILSMGHGIPGLAVDTHVGRISSRLGYTQSKNPLIVEKDLCAVIPREDWKRTHLLFIRHGRVLCKARNPECIRCPLSELCVYYNDQ